MSLIFLTGMMGAGKTYWSRVWANATHWQVIDMDEMIEQETGKSISKIFEDESEATFREIEHKTLIKIIADNSQNTIVACGGGTPFFHGNLSVMKAAGCVVYLQASIDELIQNLGHKTVGRPKLNGNVEERLSALLEERRAGYESAHHIIPIKSITPTTFAEILTACTNRHS